jgi:hypothetical protein
MSRLIEYDPLKYSPAEAVDKLKWWELLTYILGTMLAAGVAGMTGQQFEEGKK